MQLWCQYKQSRCWHLIFHMHKSRFHFQFFIVPVCYGTVAVLAVVYIGLIGVVMSYAALTVEFSQSVKADQASVAVLEGQYLSSVSRIQNMDYRTAGYAAPLAMTFVHSAVKTALR